MSVQPMKLAWPQFLVAKWDMLYAYDRARKHAKTQRVQTHHGPVGEAAVRGWLANFLPRRFGVTSGYIRSQGPEIDYRGGHFDVIIYDQLESPILWTDENVDKSAGGSARIIPAEYVRAVLEVKATFNRANVRQAANKLGELAPLMADNNKLEDLYPPFLPRTCGLAMVFFELRREDSGDVPPLEIIRDLSFNRPFYGAVILRGEGRDEDDTAMVDRQDLKQSQEETLGPDPSGHAYVMTQTREVENQHRRARFTWADTHFQRFAFDLLAMLKGTYVPGYASSLHGYDIAGWNRQQRESGQTAESLSKKADSPRPDTADAS
jgi:hypothetical protein